MAETGSVFAAAATDLELQADSEDGLGYHGGDYVRAGNDTFRVGPLPSGRYRLHFSSQEIEAKELAAISARHEGFESRYSSARALFGLFTFCSSVSRVCYQGDLRPATDRPEHSPAN